MFNEIYPHKLNIEYKDVRPNEEDILLLYKGGSAFVKLADNKVEVPTVKDLGMDKEKTGFLFEIDGKRFFRLATEQSITDGAVAETDKEYVSTEQKKLAEVGYSYVNLDNLRKTEPRHISFAIHLGLSLDRWYRKSVFCGKCGSRTVHSDKERAMVCPNCHNVIYPTISPSVIVLIRDGEEILVTRYQEAHNSYRGYALVAGYVESGETPEETVRREVMEEVGLKVKNISYVTSQPWPQSGSLLLGFVCDIDGDRDVKVEEDELELAEWINRKDLPDRSKDASLTSHLIEMFRQAKL